MKTKIILDVDTGTDDAVALMLAILHPKLELIAACSVNGNQPIDKTTENTLRVVEYLDRTSIPVYRGCEFPMVSTLEPGRKPNMPRQTKSAVHGDWLPIPQATVKIQEKHAVNYIVDTYMSTTEEIILVPTGPLTNIGMALRMEPKIAERIPRIVIMGGGHAITNAQSAASEYNFWVDPESARIVMKSGVPITLVPLDATHAAYITNDEAIELGKVGTPAAKAASIFIQGRIKGYALSDDQMKALNAAPVHDALAVAAIVDPEMLEDVVNCYVDIDCSGSISDGRSLCDVLNRTRQKPNADVALSANREKFREFLFETLALK